MDHTLNYHLAHYKMFKNFRAVLVEKKKSFFFFVSVMLILLDIFYLEKVTGNRQSYCTRNRAYFRQK